MRHLAAHERDLEHAGQSHIGHVRRPALQEPGVLDPGHPLPDQPGALPAAEIGHFERAPQPRGRFAIDRQRGRVDRDSVLVGGPLGAEQLVLDVAGDGLRVAVEGIAVSAAAGGAVG